MASTTGTRLTRTPSTLRRVCKSVVRDAAVVVPASLFVEILVARRDGASSRWQSIAFAAPGLNRADRVELARHLARSSAGIDLPSLISCTTPQILLCEPRLAGLLGLRQAHQISIPVGKGRPVFGWLRFVVERRPDRKALRTCAAVARQVAGRLESENLLHDLVAHNRLVVRDVLRERRARERLAEAKDTLGALNLAGTHLMVETDVRAIDSIICRELGRLGFHSAILLAESTPSGPQPPFRYVYSSFTRELVASVERLIGRSLESLRIDLRDSSLMSRVLSHGRTLYTGRVEEAARQFFGMTSDEQVRALVRLISRGEVGGIAPVTGDGVETQTSWNRGTIKHVIVAPLRYGHGVAGLLLVATDRLRPGDPDAIDAFALQASIALEKARLFAELRTHQAQLESEVERRTLELTHAVRALKEIDRRKDNFLANVSHELRTPLVTVLGYTDLVLSEKLGALSQKQKDCLRVVAGSGRRLRSFIEELLEFSRYELTKDRLEFASFGIREMVDQAVKSVAPRFEERGLEIRVRVSRRVPPVWGDRERMLQVLTNLLTNAERYCEKGGCVRVVAVPGRAGRIEMAVSDDGQGIPSEHLDRIFDRLYQVGDVVQQREKGGGLGLGLAIAKSIVEAHGGQITVRSRYGFGTRFRFSVPSADGAPAPELAPAGPSAEGSS